MMQTLVIADLTKATGRFNLAQWAIGMAVGCLDFGRSVVRKTVTLIKDSHGPLP
jgi:hypothetical protein